VTRAAVCAAAHGQLHLDLDPPKSVQPVIALAIARAQGHDAMDRAEAKAKAIDPEFIERAAMHMLQYLLEHGMVDAVVHRHRLRETLIRMVSLFMDPLIVESRALAETGR
jgi:acetyl-CoA carboxylase carboxyltransferase component